MPAGKWHQLRSILKGASRIREDSSRMREEWISELVSLLLMSKRRRAPDQSPKRYKNPEFLRILGLHCRKLRKRAGYSIDRMAREGDQLSTGTIHRLEAGLGDSHVSALLRYAMVIGVPLKKLFDFQVPGTEDF